MSKALLFSGGVESTYLYLSMMEEPIDLYVIERDNCSSEHIFDFYEALSTMFGYEHTIKLLKYPDIENYKKVIYALRELSPQYDEVIFGYNKEPEELERNDIFVRMWDDIPNVKTPLEFMNKAEVIRKYYEEGIEDILPFTITCGVKGKAPCGECYPCKERELAYEKLDLPVNLGKSYL